MPRALLSVSDKTGLVDFARGLAARGFELVSTGGPSPEFRFDLARKAFAHTGAYDTAIASTLATVVADEQGFRREIGGVGRVLLDPPDQPAQTINLALHKLRDLRYGENPHQKAA